MSPHPRRLHPAAPERLVDLQSLRLQSVPTLIPKHLGDRPLRYLRGSVRPLPVRQSESVMLTVFPTFSLPLGFWNFPGFSRRSQSRAPWR